MTEFDSREKLSVLLPHKGKMLLLDKVLSFDFPKMEIETEVRIGRECMFFEESLGGVPVWVGFEYMAQSVSCLSGLSDRERGIPPKMGFILSVTNFCVDGNVFPLGSALRVRVRQSMRLESTVTLEGEIFIGDKWMAKATIHALEVDNPQKILGVS